MKTLIIGTELNIGTEQHEIICTGVVALASPVAKTINYHLVCFALIWQFST